MNLEEKVKSRKESEKGWSFFNDVINLVQNEMQMRGSESSDKGIADLSMLP
jgi:hypothetical protein